MSVARSRAPVAGSERRWMDPHDGDWDPCGLTATPPRLPCAAREGSRVLYPPTAGCEEGGWRCRLCRRRWTRCRGGRPCCGLAADKPGEHGKHGGHPRLLRPPPLRAQSHHAPHPDEDARDPDGAREHRQDDQGCSVLSQFDLARRVEAAILRGPHEDLESYLEAVDMLKGTVRFFGSNKNFKSSEAVLNHVNNLLAKSTLKIEEEFKQLMISYRATTTVPFCWSSLASI